MPTSGGRLVRTEHGRVTVERYVRVGVVLVVGRLVLRRDYEAQVCNGVAHRGHELLSAYFVAIGEETRGRLRVALGMRVTMGHIAYAIIWRVEHLLIAHVALDQPAVPVQQQNARADALRFVAQLKLVNKAQSLTHSLSMHWKCTPLVLSAAVSATVSTLSASINLSSSIVIM